MVCYVYYVMVWYVVYLNIYVKGTYDGFENIFLLTKIISFHCAAQS